MGVRGVRFRCSHISVGHNATAAPVSEKDGCPSAVVLTNYLRTRLSLQPENVWERELHSLGVKTLAQWLLYQISYGWAGACALGDLVFSGLTGHSIWLMWFYRILVLLPLVNYKKIVIYHVYINHVHTCFQKKKSQIVLNTKIKYYWDGEHYFITL